MQSWHHSEKENPKVMFEVCSGIADDIKDKGENSTVDIGLLKEPVDISNVYDLCVWGKRKMGSYNAKRLFACGKRIYYSQRFSSQPLIFAKRESVRNEYRKLVR